MKKLLCLLSTIPMLALAPAAMASCSDGLTEVSWNKSPDGYCRIFFPNCSSAALGNSRSYLREVNGPWEVLCVGDQGLYDSYYNVTIQEANQTFNTEFGQMGSNYESEFSKWLHDNCQRFCAEAAQDVQAEMTRAIEE